MDGWMDIGEEMFGISIRGLARSFEMLEKGVGGKGCKTYQLGESSTVTAF